MKTTLLFSLLLVALQVQLIAQVKNAQNLQNSILGTWQLISQTGTDADGNSITSDLTKVKQYKIITPTHWMYVNYNPDQQVSSKVGGDGGTYELKGSKYIEKLEDADGAKTDFRVKVEGDKYYQDGAILLSDGKKVVLHEVYQRIQEPDKVNMDVAGVWNLMSVDIIKDGKKEPTKGSSEMHIITPTHFMWIQKQDGKYRGAMVGTYTKEGKIVKPTPIIAPYPVENDKVELKVSINGEQMITNGTMIKADGTKEEWVTVHKKIGKAVLAKSVSTK